MTRPRVSIARSMILMGIVGVELGLGRALAEAGHGHEVIGVAPTVVAVEVAVALAWFGRWRAFGLGFAAFAIAAAGSFVYGDRTRPTATVSPGKRVVVDPGSIPYRAWNAYQDRALGFLLGRVPGLMDAADSDDPSILAESLAFVLVSLAFSAPQLIFGGLGGLVAVAIGRLVSGRSRPGQPHSTPSGA